MKGASDVTDTDDEDLRLLRMGPSGDRGYVIEITGRTVAAIAGHLAAWLREHEAENYTETEFTHYETPFTVTVQRNNGQTPHQLRRKAEAERDDLRALVAEFIGAEDATNREAELHEEEGRAWSSAPVVRRLHAVDALRAALQQST